jgi:TRAP-type C4-dicarboxylate transport system permease small subunit
MKTVETGAELPPYIRAMDRLYQACLVASGIIMVLISLFVAWGVYTRYVLNQGSFWAEPVSIMLVIQMTFFGAAACYRANAHISIDVLVRPLPEGRPRWLADRMVDLLVGVMALAMIWYGTRLVSTTWFQLYPEFQQIRVGTVYLALPLSGLVTLLFVIERLVYGPRAGLESHP